MKKIIYNLVNRTLDVESARKIGVDIKGDCRFIKVTKATFGSEPYLIKLGEHITIAEGVRFITHDGGVWVFRNEITDIDVIKPISVGNNVFIGMKTIIMPGVNISDNVVIGAGSIVTKDILEAGVYVGSPARKIKELEEYREQSIKNNLKTKTLSAHEKKNYLTGYFYGDDND